MVDGNYGENPDPKLERLERRDSEKVYWDVEKKKRSEKKWEFFRNGFKNLREKYLENNQ